MASDMEVKQSILKCSDLR